MPSLLQGIANHWKKELIILKHNFLTILLCIFFNYVHAVGHNLAYYLHVPSEPLFDLGFALLPGLNKQLQISSEVAFFLIIITGVCFMVSPLLNHNRGSFKQAIAGLDGQDLSLLYTPSHSSTNVLTFLSKAFASDPNLSMTVTPQQGQEGREIEHYAQQEHEDEEDLETGPYPPPPTLPSSDLDDLEMVFDDEVNFESYEEQHSKSLEQSKNLENLDGAEDDDFAGFDEESQTFQQEDQYNKAQKQWNDHQNKSITPNNNLGIHNNNNNKNNKNNNNNNTHKQQSHPGSSTHTPQQQKPTPSRNTTKTNQFTITTSTPTTTSPNRHSPLPTTKTPQSTTSPRSTDLSHAPSDKTDSSKLWDGQHTLIFNEELTTAHPPKYGLQILTRFLSVLCLSQALRTVCFLVTGLPGPNYHCRPFSQFYNPPKDLGELLGRSDAFFSCGDLVFSSHTTFILLCALLYTKYGQGNRGKLIFWCLVGVFCSLVIAARKHYTLDIFIACYAVPLNWFVFDMYCPDEIPVELAQLELEHAAAIARED